MILWLNVKGPKNLDLLLSSPDFFDYDFIFLSETWIVDFKLSSNLNNHYDLFTVDATREGTIGRFKGGLIYLFRKNYSVNLINSNVSWLFVYVKELDLVFGQIYFPPRTPLSTFHDLQNVMEEIGGSYPSKLIIGGDTNARIGLLNQGDEEWFEGTNCYAERLSMDYTEESNGRHLVNIMQDLGCVVLNGRSVSDSPANFTFVGPQGYSCIDLIWCSVGILATVVDFGVSDFFLTSDHLPCVLTIGGGLRTVKIPLAPGTPKIFWNQDEAIRYKDALQSLSLEYGSNLNPEEEYQCIKNLLINVCKDLNLYRENKNCLKGNLFKKPWFDQECHSAKYLMCHHLRTAKRQNFSPVYVNLFLQAKRTYLNLLILKRETYEKEMVNNLCDVKNSKQFWTAVKKYSPRNQKSPELDIKEVESHFREVFSRQNDVHISIRDQVLQVDNALGVFNITLDGEISVREFDFALKHCKNNKAGGEDLLIYELFKNMPESFSQKVVTLFNKIITTQSVPHSWSNILMFLLFKKGDVSNIDNYRGISLINVIAKLFTRILCTRLTSYCEQADVLPENQCGFRAGRSCLDQVFTLSTVIHLNIRLPKSKVFAAFVDFRKAFDGLLHDVLWFKLFKLGVSVKFIKILKSMYNNAQVQIRINNPKVSNERHGGGPSFVGETPSPTLTNFVSVEQGILQGDTLSPLLFNLFIADFEEYLRSNGVYGLNIDGTVDLVVLFYADDLVLLGSSQIDLQRKLNLLKKYCDTFSLCVNVPKSKIVIFRKKGGYSKNISFHYNGETMEIVKDFTYLGIKFSSSGLFHVTSEHAYVRGKAATAKMCEIVKNSKVTSLDVWKKLFESVVIATSLYCAEVWAWRYVEVLERVQSYFYKSVLYLTRSTPGHFLRIELGLVMLKKMVLQRMMGWWSKLLSMSNDRFPKLCYLQLVKHCDNIDLVVDVRYSWCAQVKQIMNELGFEQVWLDQCVDSLKFNEADILDTLESRLRAADLFRVENSRYGSVYRCLLTHPVGPSPSVCLASGTITLVKKRFLTQIRLSGDGFASVSYGGVKSKFNGENTCSICNTRTADTLFHFFCFCPVFKKTRKKYLGAESLDLFYFFGVLKAAESSALVLDNLSHYFLFVSNERNFILENPV